MTARLPAGRHRKKANAGRTQTSLENAEKVLANEADTDYNALKRESEKELQNNQEIEIQSKKGGCGT